MKEVEPDNKWIEDAGYVPTNTPQEFGETELVTTGPSEAELLTITLLTRLYDIGMAILTVMDEEKAGMVFDAHDKGENFNPELFIPDLSSNE